MPGAKGATRRRKVHGVDGAGKVWRGRGKACVGQVGGRARGRSVFLEWECSGSETLGLPQPCSRPLSSILGRSNLKFAGMPITLTVSTSSLNLMAADCKQVGGVSRGIRGTDG